MAQPLCPKCNWTMFEIKATKVATDIFEDVVRTEVLPLGPGGYQSVPEGCDSHERTLTGREEWIGTCPLKPEGLNGADSLPMGRNLNDIFFEGPP
jgi:hypothetical protein